MANDSKMKDEITTRESLMGQLAMIMETYTPSSHGIDDKTLVAYFEGELADWQRAQVREVLATNDEALELFMALAEQFDEMKAPSQDAVAQTTIKKDKESWWQTLQSRWLALSGGAGGLVAAGFALVMVLSPSLDRQVIDGFNQLPGNATPWSLPSSPMADTQKGFTHTKDIEEQAFSHGLYVALTTGSMAAKTNQPYRTTPPACDNSANCEKRKSVAEMLGTWVGLTQLYCENAANITAQAWGEHLGLTTKLQGQANDVLTNAVLTTRFNELAQLIVNQLDRDRVDLKTVCGANQKLIRAYE